MAQQWDVESIAGETALQTRINELRDAGTGVEKIIFNTVTNTYTILYLTDFEPINFRASSHSIEFVTSAPDIDVDRQFASTNNIVFNTVSDLETNVQREFTSGIDIIFDAVSDLDTNVQREFAADTVLIFNTVSEIELSHTTLTFIDSDYQGSQYEDVWADDSGLVYAACHEDGIRSYSVDGSGNLTFVDSDDQGGDYQGIWGDGTYIYAACGSGGAGGLRSYSADGVGNLTFVNRAHFSGNYEDVWGDGNFLYVACNDEGIQSFSVDGAGNLTYIDQAYAGGNYFGVYADSNFVYAATVNGLRTYSVDGAGYLTPIDVDNRGFGWFRDVWGDGNFIYAACLNGGLRSYSVDGSGILTYISTNTEVGTDCEGVWGDGAYVYAACGSGGIGRYTADESGGLKLIDSDYQTGGNYRDVFGDSNFTYIAANESGIYSYRVVEPVDVLADYFDYFNNANWEWQNPDNSTSFTGGQWARSGVPTNSLVHFLRGRDLWNMGGEFEVQVEFDITGMGGGDIENQPFFSLGLYELSGKGSSYFILGAQRIYQQSSLEWFINTYEAGKVTFGDLGATMDSKLKIVKNPDNSLTAWVWTGSQWEWGGNTAGYTTGPNYEENMSVSLTWDNSDAPEWAYLNGGVSSFRMISGTLNVL